MLPPLLLSVRVPTMLARFWRSLFSEKPGAGLPHRGPLSIIVFRLDSMGDLVMTTPLFRELKHAFPKSHCTVVVQRALKPLLVTNPHIDEILTPPQAGSGHLPRRVNELLAAWLLYWRRLRGRRFDIAISPRWDLDEHLATLLCLLTNATRRVGYTEKASPLKQRLNRGFDDAFNICLSAGPVRHEVVRNLMVLEALGGTVGDSRLEIWLTGRDRAFAARLLASVPAATRVIALGIGATTA
jgi:ADP-heptose:LPS heptosyltransferase